MCSVFSGRPVTPQSLNRKNRGSPRGLSRRVIVIRAFASLSALGLVTAFAIVALLPPDMDLGAMLLSMNPRMLGSLHVFLATHGLAGIWRHLLLPFLQRPGWMLPLMVGLVAFGIAFSLNHFGPTRQSTRRSG